MKKKKFSTQNPIFLMLAIHPQPLEESNSKWPPSPKINILKD